MPSKEALICGQTRLAYRQVDQLSDNIAKNLIQSGLLCHDRVAVFLDNSIETVLSIYGTSKAGGTFVILNGTLKAPRLAYILDNAGPRFIIAHTTKARILKEALERIRLDCTIIWVSPTGKIPRDWPWKTSLWETMIKEPSKSCYSFAEPGTIDRDLACLVYTSGSTGTPKGIMTPHATMLAVSHSIISYLENTEDDIILNVLPMSFGYGLYQVIMAFMFGGTVILEKSLVYLHNILERISQEKATAFPFVPTIAAMLFQMQDLDRYDFSSLRYVSTAGAALPMEHIRRVRKLIPNAQLFSMYGLTECARVSYLDPSLVDIYPDSVGKAIPHCEVFLLDENHHPIPNGQIGELAVRGSNLMPGYWNDPVLTCNVFREDILPGERVLLTGDLFRQDEQGLLYFVGRKDDMINTRGERISPLEIEHILSKMSDISEVAVIGVPHDVFGQAVKSFIVIAAGSTLTEDEIRRFCNMNMENFMVPEYIQIVDNLPKTPNGKIDKKVLKEMEKTEL
ncbi:MAG: acyl--CoA ligase [Sedimentisphaerales bacterium]|nr:acyl--CoA ligase [Sedimentisphaerales bacterium]